MRTILGIIIILLGLGFLLQQTDVPGADTIMSIWWPILVMAIGLLAWNGNRRMWFGPLVIVLVGLALLLDQLDAFDQSAWNFFWPLIIIFVGTRIFLGKSWEGPTVESSADANASVIFSGAEKKVTGSLKHASLSAWFGGIKVDLRGATIEPEAVLDVTVGFGGIEIIIPKGVNVVSNVTPIFGGVEDKTDHAPPTVTLSVRGTTMFGGVELKN